MISSGLSGTKVVDGEIYALSWSSENPELPLVTIDELASRAGSDRDVSAPVAAVRTEGESANANSGSASWELAAGALVFVMVVAGVLIYRARSSRGTTS